MPTGYTADVATGAVTEFSEFAMNCARAFGALVSLRDEPRGEIPTEFKPDLAHHDDGIARARMRLAELDAMNGEEIAAACEAAYARALDGHNEREAQRIAQKKRYMKMLSKVQRWTPPTPEHEDLARFMAEQLRESIDFDCRAPYPPEPQLPEEWAAAERDRTEWSLKYHLEQRAQEIKRAENRTAWIQALKSSLERAHIEGGV